MFDETVRSVLWGGFSNGYKAAGIYLAAGATALAVNKLAHSIFKVKNEGVASGAIRLVAFGAGLAAAYATRSQFPLKYFTMQEIQHSALYAFIPVIGGLVVKAAIVSFCQGIPLLRGLTKVVTVCTAIYVAGTGAAAK